MMPACFALASYSEVAFGRVLARRTRFEKRLKQCAFTVVIARASCLGSEAFANLRSSLYICICTRVLHMQQLLTIATNRHCFHRGVLLRFVHCIVGVLLF